MINVSIVGAGQTKFGRHDEYDLRELFALAAHEAIEEAGITPKDVEAAFIGNLSADQFNRQTHIAPMMADAAGMKGVTATKCEAACASSATALRAAILAIESGQHDVVMAAGVEKMTDLPTPGVIETLAMAADQPFEAEPGITFPGIFAIFAVAHMAKYGTTKEQLAAVAVKNHANAVHNPLAQYQKEITIDKVLSSRMVAWPLGLFDCSPISDGASCLLLVAEEIAREFTDEPVYIIGSGQASDHALHERPDLTTIGAACLAAQQAYEMAVDALGLALTSKEGEREPLPAPSAPDTISVEPDSFLVIVEFDMAAYKKRTNSKAVKKTLSIPEWLNEEATSMGVNFSQVLQEALIEKIRSRP